MVFVPLNDAYASVFTRSAEAQTLTGTTVPAVLNSQTAPAALTSNIGPGMLTPEKEKKAVEDVVISDAALAPTMGPAGNAAEVAADTSIDIDTAGAINFYTVKDGDTVGSIAKMYGVTPATIRSANDLKAGAPLKKDTLLVILPVSGVQYTVKKGDTFKKIATAYKVDAADIIYYNGFDSNASLTAGDTIIIPDSEFDGVSGTGDSPAKTPVKTPTKTTTPSKTGPTKTAAPINTDGLFTTNKNGANPTPITVHPAKLTDKINMADSLAAPVDPSLGRLSQGLHGWDKSGIDIAAPLGSPVNAIAAGKVIYSRVGGYNDGYGNYVILLSVIDGHQVESIYAHLSQVLVTTGQTVAQGDMLGKVGKTGDATGYHLHMEVRGAKNTLISYYRRQ